MLDSSVQKLRLSNHLVHSRDFSPATTSAVNVLLGAVLLSNFMAPRLISNILVPEGASCSGYPLETTSVACAPSCVDYAA